MRIVVTGGAGFIGSHLADSLVADRHEVMVIDDLSTGHAANIPPAARLTQADIRSPEAATAIAAFQPEAVYHLAAQASVTVSDRDPLADASINILGGLNVLGAAIRSGAGRFVYTNTGGALYGDDSPQPFEEDGPILPISPYGLSKSTLERYALMLAPPEMSVACMRLANVYGPRQDPHGEAGVVAIFARRMLAGQPVTIYGDGEQTRDFIHVSDVVAALRASLDHPGRLSVNVSTGQGTSVNEICRLIAQAASYGNAPEYAPARPREMRHSVLSNRAARATLGWLPAVALADGIVETVEWMRQSDS